MKNLLPIISKITISLFVFGAMFLSSCSKVNTSVSSSKPANYDIQWNDHVANTNEANTETQIETDKVVNNDKEISKKEIENQLTESIAATKESGKLNLKEKVAVKLLSKKINKLSPEKKAEIQKQLKEAKGKAGLRQALLTIFIGLAAIIIAWLLGQLLWILGVIVYIIGALIILYGLWLLLEELVL